MSFDEITEVYKAISKRNKEEWERTRIQCFYIATAMGGSKTIKKPDDLFKLAGEIKEHKSKSLTKAQIELNRKEAEKWLETM